MQDNIEKDYPLKVAINAQFSPGDELGGMESVVRGLIKELGKLQDGPEEYTIIGPWEDTDWLSEFTGTNQKIVRGLKKATPVNGKTKAVAKALSPVIQAVRKFGQSLFMVPTAPHWPAPVSNGFYENLDCDVIHFPHQTFAVCAMPMIYNPHDLVHLHYPQYYKDAKSLVQRDSMFRWACHFAKTVVVASQWVKQDVMDMYGLPDQKVQVVPWASPTEVLDPPSAQQLKDLQKKYDLKTPFAFYPASIQERKNHINLLKAVALLKDRENIRVNLVCTGSARFGFWPEVEKVWKGLNLQDQVIFLGHVPSQDLRGLYRLAQFVVQPTFFEAASGPMYEAWTEGVAITCSNVTSLPEQAGDSAILFDPFSVEEMADSIKILAANEQTRKELVEKGKKRLSDFSWDKTAKGYRAVYRKAAGRKLSDEDKKLLSHNWMELPQDRTQKR